MNTIFESSENVDCLQRVEEHESVYKELHNKIIYLYNNGRSLLSIAKEVHLAHRTIKKILIANGIAVKTCKQWSIEEDDILKNNYPLLETAKIKEQFLPYRSIAIIERRAWYLNLYKTTEDLTNQKFGLLTVISFAKRERYKLFWNCKCECSNTKIIRSDVLKNSKSCGCQTKDRILFGIYNKKLNRFEQFLNKNFGYLIVKSISNLEKGTVLCKCICGNNTIQKLNSLVYGHVFSCGCYLQNTNYRKIVGDSIKEARGTSSNIEKLYKDLYSRYFKGAQDRSKIFNLTLNQFIKFITDKCYYCGIKNSNIRRLRTKYRFEELSYNGIDRVDNNKGYTFDNCVTCCRFCNSAKSNRTLEEFIDWVGKIYFNFNEKVL